MRILKFLFVTVLAIFLIIVGFANRQPVTLTLFPGDLVPFTKYNAGIELPLYMVVFGGLGAGLLIGFIWEWLREARIRSEAARDRRERARLAQEVKTLKADKPEGKDEIIALVDGRKPAA